MCIDTYIYIYIYHVYIYIYIYIFRENRAVMHIRDNHTHCIAETPSGGAQTVLSPTANLRTEILDSRGFDSSRILTFKGWNSHVHREFTGSFESTNLCRDNLSRETGQI